MQKERVLWADICKGLLITLLMFNHLVWVAKGKQNVENDLINLIGTSQGVYTCFFMSCFVLLSGMFSNFKKTAKDFVISNFKVLIFPALVSLFLFNLPNLDYSNFIKMTLLYGGGLWFLTSLFFSKLFLWLCLKYIKKEWIIIAIMIVMSLGGKILDEAEFFPNYWYHRNFLNFCLYLGIGYFYKDLILNKVVGIVSIVAFILSVLPFFIMDIRIPNVVAFFNETLLQHPLTMWLSVTGSIACVHVCKATKSNEVLEFLGRNSLIVYIYHMIMLPECISLLASSLNGNSIRGSLIPVFMIIVSTLVFCSGVAVALNTKYLKWMKGSF